MSWSWPGAAVGLVIGLGLLLVVYGVPRWRTPTLAMRVDPYVRDEPVPARLFNLAPHEQLTVHHLVDPFTRGLGRRLGELLGGHDVLVRRLERAGLAPDVQGYRAQQAVLACLLAAAGAALGVLLWSTGRAVPVIAPALALCGGLSGVMLRDQLLARRLTRREHRIVEEFPAVAELLALAVAAGESASAALERVARLSRGELSRELTQALGEARTGASLPNALEGIAERTGVPSVARFVDGVIIAVERGTPLAEVLRAQATDAREAARQQIIAEGGRREILMMIPVVFFVLPVTVVFAMYPGLSALQVNL
ncbi:type II secretion system F family protein [Kytococcus sp. Marseille-QA3725]